MSSAHNFQPISVSDYLEGESRANRKHEYIEGAVYAMAGATNSHNRMATNVTGSLYSQLRGHRCQVFNSDTKIRVRLAKGTRFYYPDASVVCRLNQPSDTFHDAPIVIVEVVSESTRRTDEKEKCVAYSAIDSMRVYILIEQNSAIALVYRRGENGLVSETYFDRDSIIPLPEIDCTLKMRELYENVSFPSAEELREQLNAYEA